MALRRLLHISKDLYNESTHFGRSLIEINPTRVKKLQISTNICGKKMKESGYQFKWTFEEALEDWFKDNKNLYLE